MRDQLLDFLIKELVGPDPTPPYIQPNGEEILINEPPRLRYCAGILFPHGTQVEDGDKNDKDEQEILESAKEEYDDSSHELDTGQDSGSDSDDSVDSTDEMLNLANAYLPSAMGFSCFINIPPEGFKINIKAGTYRIGEYASNDDGSNVVPRKAYFRIPLDIPIHVEAKDLPIAEKRYTEISIPDQNSPEDHESSSLVLNIRNRTPHLNFGDKNQLYTFSLINRIQSESTIRNEDCFFQVEFSIQSSTCSPCFLPYPEKKSQSTDEDGKSNRLLYRNKKNYAVGHGCAPKWSVNENGEVIGISTSTIPTYEIKPVLPIVFPDIDLQMYDFSDFGNFNDTISNLNLLCNQYEIWIKKQEALSINFEKNSEQEFAETAKAHINNCKKCLARMRDGVKLLKEDRNVQNAFQYMNRAMLMQQLHYNLPMREWQYDTKGKNWKLPRLDIPNIHDRTTWSDWDNELKQNKKLGQWRPFQIAFILMNLKSIALTEDFEREIVDLIWFPTGGGKTEAYLGLTAFTIFLKRLHDKTDDGTTVLMRYTLRLLTAQQYQRASSLIASCDLIRKENEEVLGPSRITIGLWAGQGLTPNTRAEAVKLFKSLCEGQNYENPFIILKCPWCAAQMGQIQYKGQTRVKGYFQKRKPSTIIYKCDNSECSFSSIDFSLPLIVIDEDIYETPPTLIIGTVDKFAILPWKPQARTIFGFRENNIRKTPPELIIQDELHLISGPLGSMVGHYETLIDELCTNAETQIRAKIIASTATISRAKEQCNALFNCGRDNVFQFPPQCIEAGDSFFAFEAKDAPGRLYAGIYAASGVSHAMAEIRVISALLQGTKSAVVSDEKIRNYYWTILNYFNSLRELGHAATLVSADIREYLNAMWSRKCIRKTDDFEPRRFINRHIELTSRIPSGQIPHLLQALEVNYPGDDYPVDICLATNMISVGVDVQRLGLMTVVGQPKTTSEYIQATSRVGRSKEGPGLVVVIFNTQKPRDRSHYEHFHSYHSRLYSQVEPTSVTPFAAPVRERALHALMIGLLRYFYPNHQSSPQPTPDRKTIHEIHEILKKRVSGVDQTEEELVLKLLEERYDDWVRIQPSRYGDFYYTDTEAPLIYPAGSTPQEEWENRSWPTPTSMRNVDASCEAYVISNYLIDEDEEE